MPGAPRGRGRGGSSGGSGRGQVPGQKNVWDLQQATRTELGMGDLYSVQQVDKPPPLYPHRPIPKRKAPLEPTAEERQIAWSEEMVHWTQSSPFALADGNAKRLTSYLADVLKSDVYPKELVAPRLAPSAKRSRGDEPAIRRKRQNSLGEDVDELAEREKTEGEEAEGDAAGADGVVPPRRRRDDDEEGGAGDDDELEDEEDEEDFNDYAEYHDEDDGDEDGDDDYGGGGREAEY